MLHRVSNVNVGPSNASLFEGAIKELPGIAHERLPLAVFVIAWLLPHHNDAGVFRSFTEDRLRSALV
jgi:hypothetical protein